MTLRIKPCTFTKDHEQVACYLSGPDNESSYTQFAFVDGRKRGVWNRYKSSARIVEALDVLLNGDADDAGRRYAMQSGNCYICNRTLTTPESIERGIGPICAEGGM